MACLETIGKIHHKGYKLLLFYGAEGVFELTTGYRESFRIVFVEEGAGIIRIGSRRHIFTGPVIFCFNEKDTFSLESSSDYKAHAIWFHPTIINASFNFEKIQRCEEELTEIERQDIYWLKPFRHTQNEYEGQLDIGPGLVKQISKFFQAIKNELEFQDDLHWPCRSRTFLIELLFLLSQINRTQESAKTMLLDKTLNTADDVILYLHSNYIKKITINELTSVFHINRTTLADLFTEATGITVIAYLIKLRLYMTSQMLKETLLPVSEIIERVGFNDAAHFGRMFKKQYGCSPTQYRVSNCWMLK